MQLRLNLSDFFQKDENVLFAFVFGSCVKGRQHKESDIDIGIYFKRPLEGFAILEYIINLAKKHRDKGGQKKYNESMEKTEKEDARKLTQETQEQMRKQGIRLRWKGKTYKEIGEIV